MPQALLEQFDQHFLPLRGITITLQTSRDVELKWFHQASLHAWLRSLLSHSDKQALPPDLWMRIDAPECGRTHYQRGDCYRFSLFCLAPGWAQCRALLNSLCYPEPHIASPSSHKKLAFGDHWAVVDIVDFFSDAVIEDDNDVSEARLEHFYDEAALWLSPRAREFTWQWLSPARISLPPEQKRRAKGENRFCRDSRDTHLELLLLRCWDASASLLRDIKIRPSARQNPPPSETTRAEIFWIDHHYSDKAGTRKPLGGQLGLISGNIHLDHHWLALVMLCQYLGLGQRCDFGLGRFRLEGANGEYTYKRAAPFHDWLHTCLSPSKLEEAWRHVRTSRPQAAEQATADLQLNTALISSEDEKYSDIDTDADNTDIEGNAFYEPHEFDDEHLLAQSTSIAEILENRVERLHQRTYNAPATSAGFIPKDDGSLRPLAVPPFWDAVLQRAVAAQISTGIDSLMYERSYGYRLGRSRHQAAEAIQQARRDGYRWVFDADIEDFFGSVNHARLQARLLALFDDSAVINAILGWVQAPVHWRGKDYPRQQGLPQGSSLSPVLANLMLDDFDNDMQAAGLRLVRFADDFVILSNSRQRAEQAASLAADSLREQGFELNADKTGIRDIDSGMDFLGYLFVGDMALDLAGRNSTKKAKANNQNTTTITLDQQHQQAVAAQWLAKLAGNPPKRLDTQTTLATEANTALAYRDLEHQEVLSVGEEQLDSDGLVFVAGTSCSLYTNNRRLVISRGDTRLLERPWAHIKQVLLFGNHHITTPALRAACYAGTTVHLVSATGRYQACISNNNPSSSGHRLWLEQAVCSEDPVFALSIAKALVAARLRHQHEVLRLRGNSSFTQPLTALLHQVEQAIDAKQLNGIEGSAAAQYFDTFGSLLPEIYQFKGRKRRPPPDPANALLSFGFTMLYGYQDTLLRAHGLHPWIGLYHRGLFF